MFEDFLSRLEPRLDVPYPARALLLEELAGDLELAYEARRKEGLAEAEAREAALKELELGPEALASLAEIHRPAARRLLARLPARVRDWLEALWVALPFAALVIMLATQVPLILFLREGGFTMYLILALGVTALFLEIHRFFLWFVLRDHSPGSLKKNTALPLYLAAAALGQGISGTALNLYVVLRRWNENALPADSALTGLRESLTCVILAATLATMVVLAHGMLSAGLRVILAPEVRARALR
jgi:hypothetical protein